MPEKRPSSLDQLVFSMAGGLPGQKSRQKIVRRHQGMGSGGAAPALGVWFL